MKKRRFSGSTVLFAVLFGMDLCSPNDTWFQILCTVTTGVLVALYLYVEIKESNE